MAAFARLLSPAEIEDFSYSYGERHAGSGAGGTASSDDSTCDREAARYGEDEPLSEGNAHANYQFVLLGLSLMLIGGGCIQHYLIRVPLPYTALVFFFGCIMGVWVLFDPNFTLQPGMTAGTHAWSGHVLMCNVTDFVPNDLFNNGYHLGNSWRVLAEMPPHLFLNVLLPPLLFESAFAIDWHIFQKLAGHALILALPGLVVASTLTGGIYAWFYAWPWESCVLLGGILSATDPVAVVALLREMGVKKSLATLIEAESLLNDGTAVVVYSIFLKAVEFGGLQAWLDAEGQQPIYLLWVTVRMSIIGPLMGVAFGVVTILFLEQNWGTIGNNDANVETICTLAMPFLVFYLAETAFGETWQMSGVLAVVAYGLVFASPWGRVRIDPKVMHFLHEFWPMVGHLTNTLIFSIAGVLVVIKIADQSSLWENLGYGTAIYFFLTLIRGVIMFAVIPLFRRSQYGYDWREALVSTWGGLRGAVSLALSVALSLDEQIVDCAQHVLDAPCISGGDQLKQVAITHVCLVVALTLIVNASSCGALLRKLGLTKLGHQKEAMLDLAGVELEKMQLELLKTFSTHPVHSDINWEGVQRLVNFEAMIAKLVERPCPKHDPDTCWQPSHVPPKLATTESSFNADGTSAHAGASSGSENGAVPVENGEDTAGRGGEDTPGRSGEDTPGRGIYSFDGGTGLSPHVPRPSEVPIAEEASHELSKPVFHPAAKSHAVRGMVAAADGPRHNLLREAECRLLARIKAHVHELFEKAMIRKWTSSRLEQLLQEQSDVLEFTQKEGGARLFCFDPMLKHLVTRHAVERASMWFDQAGEKCSLFAPFSGFASRILVREFARGYDLAMAYLRVHEELQEEHSHGKRYSLSDDIDATMKAVVEANIEQVTNVFTILRMDYPMLCTCINTVEAARLVLNSGKHLVDDIKKNGELPDTEADRLLQLIHDQSTRLLKIDPLEAMPALRTSASRVDTRARRTPRKPPFISTNESRKLSTTAISKLASALRRPLPFSMRREKSASSHAARASRGRPARPPALGRAASQSSSRTTTLPVDTAVTSTDAIAIDATTGAVTWAHHREVTEKSENRMRSESSWLVLHREISSLRNSHHAAPTERLEATVADSTSLAALFRIDAPAAEPPWVRRIQTT